jgi:hypothetical protein
LLAQFINLISILKKKGIRRHAFQAKKQYGAPHALVANIYTHPYPLTGGLGSSNNRTINEFFFSLNPKETILNNVT